MCAMAAEILPNAAETPAPHGHVAAVHPIERDSRPSDEEISQGGDLVGSMFWTLDAGDVWILPGESAFLFTDCWRRTLVREAAALDAPATRGRVARDTFLSLARRWLTGECLLFDLYEAERDGAELGISSDEIGGNLYRISLERCALICRKTVYFGGQKGALLRIDTPLAALRRGLSKTKILKILKRAAYGPGWIFQKFIPQEGSEETDVILQVDGDVYYRELAEGETVRTDPRHAYAWDATVSWRLIKFGGIVDRMVRGSIPFQVEFEGPGRLWLSNLSFGDGYLGDVLTPSYWVYRIHSALRRLLASLNPAAWI